jgi:thiol:disulfide interchange protein
VKLRARAVKGIPDRHAMATRGVGGLPLAAFVGTDNRQHDTHTGEISRAALADGISRSTGDMQ